MGVYKRTGSKHYWYKFVWNGELIQESTKQTNKRAAEQMEAARRTALAKAEVGIREPVAVPTLKHFAANEFLPFIRSRFRDRANTLAYYEYGVGKLLDYTSLADCTLDSLTSDRVAGFAEYHRTAGREVATINRMLEVLRRILKLAVEWGKLERIPPKVEMLPGEKKRERVLTLDEEDSYIETAECLGRAIVSCYQIALRGIRATRRGEEPKEPADPFLLRDATALLMDAALRPEECFRLKWSDIRDNAVSIPFGKTENARRIIPLTERVVRLLAERKAVGTSEWVFPAETKSGHIEKSSLKKQHPKACKLAGVAPFTLYTFRHTCLTRWAEYMDPYTLAYLAGHSDFATTRRYVHPQAHTVKAAMERAREGRGRYSIGYSEGNTSATATAA